MKKGITLLGVLIAMLAVTSGAFAAHHYLITSSNQIKDGVVSLSDLSPAARQALQGQKRSTAAAGPQGPAGATGARGPQGPAGATGANGARGPQGQAGVTGYEVHTWRYSKDDANSDMGPGTAAWAAAPSRRSPARPARSRWVAVTGSRRRMTSGFNSQALSDGSGVIASFPGRMDWTTTTVKPNDNSGWIVQVNDKVNLADLTLYVICASAN